MESCYSPDLFSLNNSYHLSIIRGLRSFKIAYAPVHGLVRWYIIGIIFICYKISRGVYLCLPICAFGVVTNIIHILVLTSKNMRNSAVNVILTAIAVCDAGTMLSYFTYLIHFNFTSDYCGSLMSWWWMLFLMFHISVSIALHTSSLWLAVTMAFIRMMTLRQGSLSSGWQLASNAWKISGVMYAIVIFLCTPTVISHQIMEHDRTLWYTSCDYNRTIIGENQTGSGGHQSYLNDTAYSKYTIGISQIALADHCNLYKANLWLTGIMFKVIPCAFLVVLSYSLLARISAAEKNRQRLLGDKKVSGTIVNNQNKTTTAQNGLGLLKSSKKAWNRKRRTVDHTTIMLITILLVFLLTELPQGFIAIMNAVYLRHVTAYIYQTLDDFMDLLSLVNSSLNFILYCVMSSRYRQTFWKVILPRRAYLLIFIRGTTTRGKSTGGHTVGNNNLVTSGGGHPTIGNSSVYLSNSISHQGARLLIKSSSKGGGVRHLIGSSNNNENSTSVNNFSGTLSSCSGPRTPILPAEGPRHLGSNTETTRTLRTAPYKRCIRRSANSSMNDILENGGDGHGSSRTDENLDSRSPLLLLQDAIIGDASSAVNETKVSTKPLQAGKGCSKLTFDAFNSTVSNYKGAVSELRLNKNQMRRSSTPPRNPIERRFSTKNPSSNSMIISRETMKKFSLQTDQSNPINNTIFHHPYQQHFSAESPLLNQQQRKITLNNTILFDCSTGINEQSKRGSAPSSFFSAPSSSNTAFSRRTTPIRKGKGGDGVVRRPSAHLWSSLRRVSLAAESLLSIRRPKLAVEVRVQEEALLSAELSPLGRMEKNPNNNGGFKSQSQHELDFRSNFQLQNHQNQAPASNFKLIKGVADQSKGVKVDDFCLIHFEEGNDKVIGFGFIQFAV